MKMHIKEFADFTGVSVRTLHYYDEIDLLKPAITDKDNGYRYYDNKSAERMFEIIFLRELDFSLKSIKDILSSPNYNKTEAFQKQKNLLTLKKERLERLIDALEKAEKGEFDMKVLNNDQYENAKSSYEKEVKEKWGHTEAYKQSLEKTSEYSEEKQKDVNEGLMAIFADFSEAMKDGVPADSTEAEAIAQQLQAYITENFYTCTKEILSGLGEMYVLDERFKANIDKYGEGTAEYARNAIKNYCNN